MSQPPFNVNNRIVNLVAEIHSKLGKLEITMESRKDLFLRKASKIKSANSSCAIEANSLSEQEVEAIVNGKRVTAPANEIIEVQNAYETYTKIAEYRPFEVESFLSAHECLMKGLIADAGIFRSGDVAVYENSMVIHIGARPEYVNGLIGDLFSWAKRSDTNPLILACVVHYEIETIHPFSDGNGRIGRLWQSVNLCNYNKLFEFIPTETLVYEHQQEYYDAIEKSRKINDSGAFIEYMLEMIAKAIDTIDSNTKLQGWIKLEYTKDLTKKDQEILGIILSDFSPNETITMEKLAGKINKAAPSIRIYLKKFTQFNILISEGENKGRRYKINPDIFN